VTLASNGLTNSTYPWWPCVVLKC